MSTDSPQSKNLASSCHRRRHVHAHLHLTEQEVVVEPGVVLDLVRHARPGGQVLHVRDLRGVHDQRVVIEVLTVDLLLADERHRREGVPEALERGERVHLVDQALQLRREAGRVGEVVLDELVVRHRPHVHVHDAVDDPHVDGAALHGVHVHRHRQLGGVGGVVDLALGLDRLAGSGPDLHGHAGRGGVLERGLEVIGELGDVHLLAGLPARPRTTARCQRCRRRRSRNRSRRRSGPRRAGWARPQPRRLDAMRYDS